MLSLWSTHPGSDAKLFVFDASTAHLRALDHSPKSGNEYFEPLPENATRLKESRKNLYFYFILQY